MRSLTLAEVLECTVDPEFGLIRYVSEVPLQPGEPELFVAIAEYADPLRTPPRAGLAQRTLMNRQSSGAGLDRESALWATVGEALERYAGMIYDPAGIVRASACDLPAEERVAADDFILFSDQQYDESSVPFARFDPQAVIGWAPARRLSDEREMLLPASLVYMAYHIESPSELLTDVYSTGLAIGPDYARAATAALRETIERDCFALHWTTRRSPRRIEIGPLLERVQPELAQLLSFAGVDLFVGDITTELGIPCILAVARPHDRPGIAIGAACHPTAAEALQKAVVECFHTYNWLIEMHRWPRDPLAPGELREFSDHVRYYLSAGRAGAAAFLWCPNERSTLFDEPDAFVHRGPEAQLSFMKAALREHGYEAYLSDITPADIADLGLNVVRATAPGLQPLWAGANRATLDRRRVDRFIAATGADPATPIYVEPHPFP